MNEDRHTTVHPGAATLNAFHDGELRGFARDDVAAHLALCMRCREALDGIGAVDAALSLLSNVEPPDVRSAVLARIAEQQRWRLATRARWGLAAVGAIVAAALAAGALLHATPIASPTTTPQPFTTQAQGAARALSPGGASGSIGVGPSNTAQHGPAQGLARLPVQGAGGATAPNAAVPSTLDARLIVRSGEVDLRVRDVQHTFTLADGIATRLGGYVASSDNNVSPQSGAGYAATLTLRLPAANFQTAMDALVALPHAAASQRTTSSDVSDSYRDLNAQIQALQATRAQLTALMRQAHSVKDALMVLDQLTAINAQLDGLQSQLQATANSVMLSAITVNIAQQPARRQVTVAVPRRRPTGTAWSPARDLAAALTNVKLALERLISGAIYGIVYLSLPLLCAAFLLRIVRLRRIRSERFRL